MINTKKAHTLHTVPKIQPHSIFAEREIFDITSACSPPERTEHRSSFHGCENVCAWCVFSSAGNGLRAPVCIGSIMQL